MTDLARRKEQAERDKLVERVSKLHRSIAEGKRRIESDFWALAGDLYEFSEERGWEVLGLDSQNEWLASPEIELQRSQFHLLVGTYRKLVVERGVEPEQLEGVSPSKVAVALPAVEDGKLDVEEAIAQAKTLTRKDIIAEHRSDQSDPTQAEARTECPVCRSIVPESAIRQEAA